MLLSQQAELLSISKDSIEIGLSPNWENMIKSRKLIIENTVRKIFGEHMNVSFKSGRLLDDEKIANKKDNLQTVRKEKINENNIRPTKNEDKEIDNKSSKNLAEFFNGEVIEIED